MSIRNLKHFNVQKPAHKALLVFNFLNSYLFYFSSEYEKNFEIFYLFTLTSLLNYFFSQGFTFTLNK